MKTGSGRLAGTVNGKVGSAALASEVVVDVENSELWNGGSASVWAAKTEEGRASSFLPKVGKGAGWCM